jgi:diketogulonate reductase-like aldo/keto reductase
VVRTLSAIPLREVLKRFVAAGATVIDTAPTYGSAEDVLGDLLSEEHVGTAAVPGHQAVGRDRTSGRAGAIQ